MKVKLLIFFFFGFLLSFETIAQPKIYKGWSNVYLDAQSLTDTISKVYTLEKNGKTREAKILANHCLNYCVKNKFRHFQAEASLALARLVDFQPEQYYYYSTSSNIFKQLGELEMLSSTSIEFGEFLLEANAPDLAVNNLLIADSLLLVFEIKTDRVKLYFSLSKAYLQLGDYSEAAIFLNNLKGFAIQMSDYEKLDYAIAQLAISYRKLGDLDQAIIYDHDLLFRKSRFGTTEEYFDALIITSNDYLLKGDYENSMKMIELAKLLKVDKGIKNWLFVYELRVYNKFGKPSQSIQLIESTIYKSTDLKLIKALTVEFFEASFMMGDSSRLKLIKPNLILISNDSTLDLELRLKAKTLLVNYLHVFEKSIPTDEISFDAEKLKAELDSKFMVDPASRRTLLSYFPDKMDSGLEKR